MYLHICLAYRNWKTPNSKFCTLYTGHEANYCTQYFFILYTLINCLVVVNNYFAEFQIAFL